MIRTEELMVGDYVYDALISQPTMIMESDFLIANNNFNGIRLSDDFLEFIGFKVSNSSFMTVYEIELWGDVLSLYRPCDKPDCYLLKTDGLNVVIRYVHELQHLLRMCNMSVIDVNVGTYYGTDKPY